MRATNEASHRNANREDGPTSMQKTENQSQQRITRIQKDYQAVEQRIKEKEELVKKLKAEVQ